MELNFVLSVVDRDRANEMTTIYHDQGLPMILTFMGRGTAKSEHLDLYGLQPTEKAVIATVADGDKTKALMKSAKRKLFIDIPGNGVIMAVPVKSVGGGRTLAYLTDNTAVSGGMPKKANRGVSARVRSSIAPEAAFFASKSISLVVILIPFFPKICFPHSRRQQFCRGSRDRFRWQ